MASDKVVRRRRYSEPIKAQVLAECAAPGASVAKVAMAHGINANVVHRWRQLAREGAQVTVAKPSEFVPVAIAAPTPPTASCRAIEVELRRAGVTMKVIWPSRGCGRLHRLDTRAAAVIRSRLPYGWPSRRWTFAPAPRPRWRAVVGVFGAARPHHAYLFANRRANRMKVLVHDGIGVWLAARRLNAGKFVWPREAGCDS